MFSKGPFLPRLAYTFGLNMLLPPLYHHPVKTLTVTFAKIIQQILSYKGSCEMKCEIFSDRKKRMQNNKGQKEILIRRRKKEQKGSTD